MEEVPLPPRKKDRRSESQQANVPRESDAGGLPREGSGVAAPMTRADCRMTGQAIKQRWQIPDEVFEKLPKRAADMALKNRSPRTALAAGRLLVDMAKANADADAPAANGGGPQIVVYDPNQGPPDPSRLPSVGEDGERILVAGSAALLPVKDARPEVGVSEGSSAIPDEKPKEPQSRAASR